jgi:hypothetical protein
MKSNQGMRDRCRELSDPNRDDYDLVVICVLDELEALLQSCGECHLRPGRDVQHLSSVFASGEARLTNEEMQEILIKCAHYVRKRHNANGWWNDRYAYYTIEDVINPALKKLTAQLPQATAADRGGELGMTASQPDTQRVPAHCTRQEPGNQLQFVLIDGSLILHQKWWIFEWGNKEGLGLPMNKREEWRAVPIGFLP